MGIMEVPKDPVLRSVLIFVVYDINAIIHWTGFRAPPLVLSSIAQVGERHSKRRAGLGRLWLHCLTYRPPPALVHIAVEAPRNKGRSSWGGRRGDGDFRLAFL